MKMKILKIISIIAVVAFIVVCSVVPCFAFPVRGSASDFYIVSIDKSFIGDFAEGDGISHTKLNIGDFVYNGQLSQVGSGSYDVFEFPDTNAEVNFQGDGWEWHNYGDYGTFTDYFDETYEHYEYGIWYNHFYSLDTDLTQFLPVINDCVTSQADLQRYFEIYVPKLDPNSGDLFYELWAVELIYTQADIDGLAYNLTVPCQYSITCLSHDHFEDANATAQNASYVSQRFFALTEYNPILGPYYCDTRCDIFFNPSDTFYLDHVTITYDAYSAPSYDEFVIDTPSTITYNTVNPLQFVFDTIGGVLDTEIFNQIKIGHLVLAVLALPLFKILINLFAGG